MQILRRDFLEPDRREVQEKALRAVETNAHKHIESYIKDDRSYNGRYVASDLFKETFEAYRASNESRNRYNAAVHNSAAVLSTIQFMRLLEDRSEAHRDTVLFLTGIPGAGKTSSVVVQDKLPDNIKAIFEGQLSKPESAISKIQATLDAGLLPAISVVHAMPEDALRNTLKRFNEIGRGASIEVMADIQGNLPDGLEVIHKKFGDNVQLRIYDVRDRSNQVRINGWNNLDILRSEGNHVLIKERLNTEIEFLKAEGRINEHAYRQAVGLPPISREYRPMDRQLAGINESDEQRRKLQEGDSKKVIVSADAKVQKDRDFER